MAEPAARGDTEFERRNEAAVREARRADRVEPRASAVSYDPGCALIIVELRAGIAIGIRPDLVPGLAGATPEQLGRVRISPSGDGLHWDDLDIDISLTGLIADALNLREWAPRIMGQTRSDAKTRAARMNGVKGGRPRRASRTSARGKDSTPTS
jgi:hypothetical protein